MLQIVKFVTENQLLLSRIEKLLKKLLNKPKDYTWDELVVVLNHFGYKEVATGKTGGSRRRFADDNLSAITLHKPHPQPVIKEYVIKQVIEHLRAKGKL